MDLTKIAIGFVGVWITVFGYSEVLEARRRAQIRAELEKPFSPPAPEVYISRAKDGAADNKDDSEVLEAKNANLNASYILIEGPSRTGKTTFVA